MGFAMSDIEYVMVMHDGGKATRFMSEDYCKDLMEQLAAAQSSEVCTVAHGTEVMEFCPYCKIEKMHAEVSAAYGMAIRKQEEIERLREALNVIASWNEGETVTGSFDEPGAAQCARDALKSTAQEDAK